MHHILVETHHHRLQTLGIAIIQEGHRIAISREALCAEECRHGIALEGHHVDICEIDTALLKIWIGKHRLSILIEISHVIDRASYQTVVANIKEVEVLDFLGEDDVGHLACLHVIDSP